MPDDRATRVLRGLAQNCANQLVQLAVGWQAMFEGPALLAEPEAGVMVIDAASGTGTINGKPAELFMATYLNEWLTAELARAGLKSSQLLSASVRVDYERTIGERDDSGRLTANSHVVFNFGEARASFSNDQPLLRHIYVPGDTWTRTMYKSTAAELGSVRSERDMHRKASELVEEEGLAEFEDMWTRHRHHFTLVKVQLGRDESKIAIIDRRTRSMVLIEDDDVLHEVIRRMRSAGVEVSDNLLD
jgi:hypothetical protein